MSEEEQKIRNRIGVLNKMIDRRKNKIQNLEFRLLDIEALEVALEEAIYREASYKTTCLYKKRLARLLKEPKILKEKRKAIKAEIVKIRQEKKLTEKKLWSL